MAFKRQQIIWYFYQIIFITEIVCMFFRGWFFILQAVVFVQHISVCVIVPFVALQSAGSAVLPWNMRHCE